MIGLVAARQEMYELFYNAWNSNTTPIVGYVPESRIQGFNYGTKPAPEAFWCRWSSQEVFEEQSTLRNGLNGNTYQHEGVIIIQLFCPTDAGVTSSFYKGQQLAEVAKNAYRGKSSENCIWFRNCRVNELEPEPEWYRFNIVIEYEYTEAY